MTLQEARTAVQQVVGDDVDIRISATLSRWTYDHRDPIETDVNYDVSIGKRAVAVAGDDLAICVQAALDKWEDSKAIRKRVAIADARQLLEKEGYTVS